MTNNIISAFSKNAQNISKLQNSIEIHNKLLNKVSLTWVGKISEHFEKISRIATYINGYAFKSEFLDLYKKVPVIRIGDIQNGILNYETCLKYDELNNLNNYLLKKNDIVIALSGATVGKTAYVTSERLAYINQRVGIIRNASKYLLYCLNTDTFGQYINFLSLGSAQPNISMRQIRNFPIPSISRDEQQKISDYLDDKCGKIDQAIEGQKKIIEKLKEYKQSVITEAVTKGLDPNVPMKDSGIEWIGLIPKHWEVRKVKTLTKIISKGTTPTTVGRDTVKDGPVKFIKAENIQNNQIQNKPHIAIDEETNEILKRSQLKLNDILFVIAGATIGKVAIIDNPQILPANTNQAVSFLRLNNPNLSKYLWYYLQSNYIKEKLHVLSVQSAQPNLSMQDLGNFCIPIPELTEQHCIITHLSTQCAKIDLAIQKEEETIEKLAEYEKSLIYECVTGKKEVL